jgi:hypothetical protein
MILLQPPCPDQWPTYITVDVATLTERSLKHSMGYDLFRHVEDESVILESVKSMLDAFFLEWIGVNTLS